jgi:hypothetical protein
MGMRGEASATERSNFGRLIGGETSATARVNFGRLVLGAAVGIAALTTALAVAPRVAPATVVASHQRVSILEGGTALFNNPAANLQELRHLGVGMVRVAVIWAAFAPDPNSHTKPQFNAADPNAYPAGAWAALDATVLDANSLGIRVMFDPAGGCPLWGQGADPGRYGARYTTEWCWKPNFSEFAQFVRALGTRYSGQFVPSGSSSPLPYVGVWELFNEPNTGRALGPEAVDSSRVAYAPKEYRRIADASWTALQATGHRWDTILIGALGSEGAQAPPSQRNPRGLPGTYGEMAPLAFVHELYCLNPSYKRYLGRAAYLRGCPTTQRGYASFRRQHPVLFQACGFSDHPYDLASGAMTPRKPGRKNPNWAEFAQIPQFEATLDRIQRSYGSGKRFPIWNTEYGYITCPPNCSGRWVAPATAAAYLNRDEYLSWRNPRIANTMQYLLVDPDPNNTIPRNGGFASGLAFYGGLPKADYYAYRMPIFTPSNRTRRGRALEVWGDVRPAPFALADGHGPQYVQIQFTPSGSRHWTTLKKLKLTDPNGYFTTWMTFPTSGWVRSEWTYPPADKSLQSTFIVNSNGTTFSRTISVTITA